MLIGDGWSFIHIAKCGGTSLRSVLKGHEVSEVLPMAPNNTVDHEFHWVSKARPMGRVFTVVRDPVDWLRSYWAHRMRHGWRDDMVLDAQRDDGVNRFILNVAKHNRGYVTQMFNAYVNVYHDIKVFRLEDGLEAPIRYSGSPCAPRRRHNSAKVDGRVHDFTRRAVHGLL